MLELAEAVKDPIETLAAIHTIENTLDDPRKRKPYITEAPSMQGKTQKEMESHCPTKSKDD